LKSRIVLLFFIPLLALAGLFALIRFMWSIVMNPAKAFAIALGFDDLGNVAGNGRLGQTISSRAAYAAKAGKWWGIVLCRALNEVSPGHCARALTSKEQNPGT
jgi:hypothetical protein